MTGPAALKSRTVVGMSIWRSVWPSPKRDEPLTLAQRACGTLFNMFRPTVTRMRCCAQFLGLALLAVPLAGASESVPAPDFALPSLDGGNYRLSEQRGEVVALVFWAHWCGGCREQLALLRDLEVLYRPWGLRVMAVSLDESPRDAARVVEDLGLSYPVMLDRDKRVSAAWDPPRLPATYLLDRSGAVRYAQVAGDGPPETKELIARMRALLDE